MGPKRYSRAALGLVFAFYLLAFMLIEFAVNDRAALLYGPKSVNGVYSAGLCCTALGYLAFRSCTGSCGASGPGGWPWRWTGCLSLPQ